MANVKRPSFRKNDRVTLASHKNVIPPYDDLRGGGLKPYVLRDTVLTVSHLTGTGSKRTPWHVVVTDGTHFWHLEPDDIMPAETSAGAAHSAVKHDLDGWLDRNGYHHAHARKQATPHPYAVSSRKAHATRADAPPELLHMFTYRNKHGSYSDVWATDAEHAKQQIHGRKDVPGSFFTISRVTNIPPRESHARMIHQEPTGRAVFAAHERDHHITTSGRRALERDQFALPPGPEEKRRGIKGRLPIDTINRARNALARAAQEHKRGDITAAQLGDVQRAVHRAWPSIGATRHAHAHATSRHCYVITMPPTAEVGSYKTKHCGSKTEARKHALWDYNKARAHDGLPPVQRLPMGTKVTKDLTKVV